MKIICASFQCESNSGAKTHPQKFDFEYFKGEDIFKKLIVKDVFSEAGFEVIPAIYAVALPAGTVEKDIYFYYAEQILQTVKENLEAKGIYIFFHGSMEVDGIGSGELYLLKRIREIVSPECVISLTMDAHANITDELCEYADIVCGFKTIPHTDQEESQLRAANALIKAIKTGAKPYMYIQRVPFLLKNDTLLTREQPLKGLIEETYLLEKQDEIFSANLFLGHCWIDAPNTSASTVVCATDEKIAEDTAKTLANKLWATRKTYKFKIEAENPEKSVDLAINGKENRIFITDSGDNTTAGAEGENLGIIKLFLERKTNKRVCVAGITNKKIVDEFWNKSDGESVFIEELGREATVKSHGNILGWGKELIGKSLCVSFGNIDAVFTEKRSAFIEKRNFDEANTDLLSYRIVVVKLGYLFEELKPFADREIFALSEGTSCVELEKLNLKKIIRPIYPLDEFEWKA
ncbi:MAG: M81 family metallopeptidase [Clostridia bacterium]|nr:M81 family metallopeptidase [Clostridia bacterium]